MSPARAGTYLRTLRHLRRRQIAGQLRRVFGLAGAAAPVRLAAPPPRLRLSRPAAPFLSAPPHARCDGRTLGLLRRELSVAPEPDWDFQGHGPLFAFHLHQFDWARDAALAPAERGRLLADWVARHRRGVGWHPAPASLRSFAWLKLLATPGALPTDTRLRQSLLASLADQLATVEAHPETHLLANHYLWNLLALVWAGLALEGSPSPRWLARQPALRAELAEQVLADGAHCERSPMYHSLLLENVLDLLNAARALPGVLDRELEAELADTASRMLGALRVLTHPDGGIALFGDSAFGIAHPPAALHAYAAALGVAPRDPAPAGFLARAGFARLEAGPFVLLATAAAPMPAHQPGHAHCDALAFELSLSGTRVVTDTGVCEYVPGPRRDASRATRSHATVEVEGREQAEVWAAHRVGGRPAVRWLAVDPPRRAEASCAGWATPGILHRRAFELDAGGLLVHDRFEPGARRVRLVLPLAPGLVPALDAAAARVELPDGRALRLRLPAAARWRVEPAPYFPEFGLALERLALVGEAVDLREAIWELRLQAS